MSTKRHCDWQNEKGVPCDDDAPIEAAVTMDGRQYRADLCKLHGQALVNAGEPSSLKAPATVTRLPKADPRMRQRTEQLVDKVDYVDLRAWLEGQGDLPAGSRGRIKQELQQKWLDAGSPRPI